MVNAAHLVLVTDTIATDRDTDKFGAEGADNELSRIRDAICLTLDQIGNSSSLRRVQGLIQLIKQVERSRVAPLNGKDQSHGHKSLLAARQLRHQIVLAHLGETYIDSDALVETDFRVVAVNCLLFAAFTLGVVAIVHIVSGACLVNHCARDEFFFAAWHEFLENLCEVNE